MSAFVPEGYEPINTAFLRAFAKRLKAEPAETLAALGLGDGSNLEATLSVCSQKKAVQLENGPVGRIFEEVLQEFRRLLARGGLVAFYTDPIFGRLSSIVGDRWNLAEMDGVITSGQFYPFGSPRSFHDQKPAARVLVLGDADHAEVPSLNGQRSRGQAPIVLERVKRSMRQIPPTELRQMKETAMESTFGASRDTCRRARAAVLSENVDQ